MTTLVVGRVVSGIGAAGVQGLVSLILLGMSPPICGATQLMYPDLFPLREVASLRSYVNIVATTGRSLGGPVGGYLSDEIGWRWQVYLRAAS